MTPASVVSSDMPHLSRPLSLDSAAVIIPTFNAASDWQQLREGLEAQGLVKTQIFIVDSSSTDGTPDLVKQAGFRLMTIPQRTFGHGATRQMASALAPDAETLIYLTQDAIPVGSDAFTNLLAAFDDPLVGAAYGRQLPRRGADSIEAHARLFNYPATSSVRSFEMHETLGLRTAFFSNSFAAYRRTAFEQVGGFPTDGQVSEDVTVVARMLMAGWKVAYQADAKVLHSHPFRLSQEFLRYFRIGLHHGRESWLLDSFGHAGGEGLRFVVSETKYLWRQRPSAIPWAALRTLIKFCGYQIGKQKGRLSRPSASQLVAHAVACSSTADDGRSAESAQENTGRKNNRSASALRRGSA